MSKKWMFAAAGLAALALLTGCAPDHGTVTGRKVESGGRYTRQPVWKVLVTDTSHRHPVYTDRPDTGWTKVSEAEYDLCRVGAAWPDCKTGGR